MLVISAPFGNYVHFPLAVPTLGTYTLEYRGGAVYRLWRMMRTLRYSWKTQSWVNALGLPNPGIRACKGATGCILSIKGDSYDGWATLADIACSLSPLAVELNLSCPNVGSYSHEVGGAVHLLQSNRMRVIAKLAPYKWLHVARVMADLGITEFHCCNTMPSPGGGWSGKLLKPYSLWAVEEVRTHYPDAVIIGGGGITCNKDAQDFLAAGATHVAVGSALFNPYNWSWIRELAEYLACRDR